MLTLWQQPGASSLVASADATRTDPLHRLGRRFCGRPGPGRYTSRPGHVTRMYAVIGDTPYSTYQIQHFTQGIGEINADADVTRVIHLGDIKSGSTRCDTSDANPNTGDFTQIKSNFDLFADPLVYTPGDNEWTDCHRANNGGHQPAGPTWTSAPLTALLRAGAAGQPSRPRPSRPPLLPAPR